ncbi:MAG: membrane protein insertase YidC [Flavobacteriaceae bacterium]|nr:membrane protein insertase YidC [Flavobacteriaceae bacterium]
MEEKKFDLNSLIGFILLGLIMVWYFYMNQPTPETLQNNQEQVVKDTATPEKKNNLTETAEKNSAILPTDSTAIAKYQSKLGAFSYASTLPSAKEETTVLENDLVKLTIANKGGQIVEAQLKKFRAHDSLPLYLIKDNNALFNLNFTTADNRVLNSKDLFFEPTFTKNNDSQILSMKLKISEDKFIEYRYEMKDADYMVDFAIKSVGINDMINTAQDVKLTWDLKSISQEKSVKYENQYSTLRWLHDGTEFDKINSMSDDEETINNVNWIAYKQQFFSSILITETPFKNAKLGVVNLVKDDQVDTLFTKQYSTSIPLEIKNGEMNYAMNWYYGPSDYDILTSYEDKNLADVINLGWGIFGWLNKWLFFPVFNFLSGIISNFGWVIILMTIVVRIFMSPLVYKSYLSSAKMKVLKPEMEELNSRLPGKENAMKRQQEMMQIYNKAGVNPMSGCMPALLQMPIFFALFQFFPAMIALRQEGFLWADDLSSYDSVFKLPFYIPFYGDHVSLFPILASVAIFFYMKMSQSQQMGMQQPTQEGMPDMQQMMKIMMYISPLMMLFFFNMYGSGLSLYYFVSNLLTIGIMLVIKHFIIDEEKIHAQIQENKKKPQKVSKFRQKLGEAMKQAQEQQEKKNPKKK